MFLSLLKVSKNKFKYLTVILTLRHGVSHGLANKDTTPFKKCSILPLITQQQQLCSNDLAHTRKCFLSTPGSAVNLWWMTWPHEEKKLTGWFLAFLALQPRPSASLTTLKDFNIWTVISNQYVAFNMWETILEVSGRRIGNPCFSNLKAGYSTPDCICQECLGVPVSTVPRTKLSTHTRECLPPV